MDIETTPLNKEIRMIFDNGVNGTAYLYTAYIYVTKENKTYKSPKVISIDIERDYVKNFTDRRIIKLAFTAGIYVYHIFPNSDNLELTLVMNPMFLYGDGPDYTRQPYMEQFKVVPVENKSPTIASDRDMPTQKMLDQSSTVEVEFDLISKTADFVKTTSVGGVFRQTTTESVVRTILTNQACQQSSDNDLLIRGVDMVPANNLELREHVVIPHGTTLYDLPQYVQKKCGGIYTSGLGCFLQNRFWYIYPAYDFTRFNETDRTITFIVVPVNKFPRVERTFRWNGSQIIALATGDILLNNAVDQNKRNYGNAVSFTQASSVLHQMVTAGGNKAVIDRGSSNTEAAISERADGVNYMPVSNAPITDNNMEEFSKLAARNAGLVVLTWENSEPDAIIPGMMAKVYYMENEQVKEAIGVIGGAQHYTYMATKGFSSDRYLNSSAITIHIDPNTI